MVNTRLIDEISSNIKTLISETPVSDIENNLRALLQGAFAKMDLVTREEFDVQSQILLQARNKLATLEQKLTEMETRLAGKR